MPSCFGRVSRTRASDALTSETVDSRVNSSTSSEGVELEDCELSRTEIRTRSPIACAGRISGRERESETETQVGKLDAVAQTVNGRNNDGHRVANQSEFVDMNKEFLDSEAEGRGEGRSSAKRGRGGKGGGNQPYGGARITARELTSSRSGESVPAFVGWRKWQEQWKTRERGKCMRRERENERESVKSKSW
jgi:hypothetical protein